MVLKFEGGEAMEEEKDGEENKIMNQRVLQWFFY